MKEFLYETHFENKSVFNYKFPEKGRNLICTEKFFFKFRGTQQGSST